MSLVPETNPGITGIERMTTERAGKGGRPPKGPKSGKDATLATRITAATRQALDEEAARSGLSLSQVVELWLDEARENRRKNQGAPADVITAAGKLVALGAAIHRNIDDKRLAHYVLVEAWLKAVPIVLGGAPISPEAMASLPDQAKYVAAGEALQQLSRRLRRAAADDPVVVAASKPIVQGVEATTLHALSDRRGFYLMPGRPGYLGAALTRLSRAGETANAEIETAQMALQPILEWERADSIAKDQASDIAQRLMAIIVGAPE
jgi:hypothetical protein